jgi:hypothetical protein
VNLPKPCSHVILFFLKRYSTPFVILVTIASLRDCIFAMSIFAPETMIPWGSRCSETFSYSSEDARSALEGMQPTLRQVPPSASSPFAFFQPSMHAVLKPSWAARTAAMYPPGPAPMTTTSNDCAMKVRSI